MENLNKTIYDYFSERTTDADLTLKDKDRGEVGKIISEAETERRRHTINLRRFIVACVCVVLILPVAITLPIVLTREEPSYYGDDTLRNREMTIEYTSNYIENNYSQFSFVFTDCNILLNVGYFVPKSDDLLAIKINLQNKEQLTTIGSMFLVVSDRFVYSQNEYYKRNAEKTTYENFTLYSSEKKTLYNNNYLYLVENDDFKLYLFFNQKDEDFLQKFLQF